ncbi:MAG: undecaprenyl/decaprenyl-phosphate alpha-N-acetylglucosaminyl 1-phosphate transferase [Alphaproteobacteria bacterium]|nr:undecaprenyl/decaprenyl-phosphate alpha-N-acetylglucosaminyl 1-phosphate transferase [Alphaproteobacteria bacterium]
MSAFLAPVIAFLFVVLLIMPLRKLARFSGIVDEPGGRKRHQKAIPPIGGIIIFSVFMLLGVFSDIVDLQKYWALYVGLIILLVSGAIDDQSSLPAILKLILQLSAASVIVFCGDVQAAYLGDLFGFGVVWTGFLSYPFTLIAVVLLINAINLTDGIDGLAGGISTVFLAFFTLAAINAGWYNQAQVLSLLIASILGFLIFNMRNPWRRKASLFLGDAGSTSLGLVIAWFAVHLAEGPSTPLEPIVVAWIIGFPVFDTCAQFYRRLCNGQDPFSPDRKHFHHHFINAGIPVCYATPFIMLIIALMGGIGYGAYALGVPEIVLTLGWIMLFILHIFMSQRPARYVYILRKCFAPFISCR